VELVYGPKAARSLRHLASHEVRWVADTLTLGWNLSRMLDVAARGRTPQPELACCSAAALRLRCAAPCAFAAAR
jgi:hypothetical protein